VLDDVAFELDKATPRGDTWKPVMNDIGQAMLTRPVLKIRLESHTDGLGDPDFNRKVTQARAELLRDYLVQQYSIDPARIEAAGAGGDKPMLPNINRKNREVNRRVELTVLQGP
jgi:outer membrane protein OmpA-like peptidoglycan-associated protein